MQDTGRKWQPTPGFLPGSSQGQRSLAGCSPRGRRELDMTDQVKNNKTATQGTHTLHVLRHLDIFGTQVDNCYRLKGSFSLGGKGLCSVNNPWTSCRQKEQRNNVPHAHQLKPVGGFHTLLVLSHFSRVRLFAALWTAALQAPLSMGFSRQEYWSGLSFPTPGGLPDSGIEPVSPASPALKSDSSPPNHQGSPKLITQQMLSISFTFT